MTTQARALLARWAPATGAALILFLAPLACAPFMKGGDAFVSPKILVVALGAFLLWLGALAGTGKAAYSGRVMAPALGLLAGASALSFLVSGDLLVSLFGPHGNQGTGLLPLALCALIFCGVQVNDIDREGAAGLIVGAAVPVSLWALVQYAHEDPVMAWSVQDGRAGSTFGSPIFLGSFLALAIPLAWHLAHDAAARTERRALAQVAGILACLALIAARSRGGFAAAACGIGGYELLTRRKYNWLLAGLAVVTVGIFARLMPPLWVDGQAPGDTLSDLSRLEIMRSALRVWRAHRWLGCGPDAFGIAFREFMTPGFVRWTGNDISWTHSAHNDLLQALATLGLVGAGAYAIFLISAWRVVSKAFDSTDAALGAALVALFVQAKVNPVPLATLAIAAAILGMLDRAVTFDPARPRAAWPTAAAGLLVLVAATTCRADFRVHEAVMAVQAGRGVQAARAAEEAATLAPWDAFYSDVRFNALWQVLPQVQPQEIVGVVAGAHAATLQQARLHPRDANMRQHRGIELFYEWQLGGERLPALAAEAARELDSAHALAPLYGPVVVWRERLRKEEHL